MSYNEQIRFDGVTAGYSGVEILRNLNISFAKGEMVGVLGPNGAGKSTLLKALTGYADIMSGSITIKGADAALMTSGEKARAIAVVPQDIETPMPYTVEEIVQIGRTVHLGRFGSVAKTDREAMERAMAYTDVIDLRDRLFSELSGGERQRVIVAMALAQEAEILLLDEATSHLDINHRLEVIEIVERLNRENSVTVIMVSHDINLVADFSDRIIIVDKGVVVADGAPKDVLREDMLAQVYNCRVKVSVDGDDGALSVTPARRLYGNLPGNGARVHVIAGGGSGEILMRRLVLSGYKVTCGVLNRGDSDAQTAAGLGVQCVLEQPFSPIGRDAVNACLKLACECSSIVLCAVPFGPGNMVNLEIAEAAIRQGRQVLLVSGCEERDYTPAKDASKICSGLAARGALICRSVTEIMDCLGRGTQG